jgi:hypothetical protein
LRAAITVPRQKKTTRVKKAQKKKMKNRVIFIKRGCSKTSAFGTASLDLEEKPGFCRFFQDIF